MEKETVETKKKEKSLLKSIGGAALAVGGLAITILTTMSKEKKAKTCDYLSFSNKILMDRFLF